MPTQPTSTRPSANVPPARSSTADLAAVEAQRRANPNFRLAVQQSLRIHRERMAGRVPKPR